MKIGILGGGQLGRMFLQNALDYPYEYHILDPSEDAPAKGLCHYFQKGDFNDYEAVMAFGKELDVLGIEIEHVNVEALETLQKNGKRIIPSPSTLKTIQDKGLQKLFFEKHQIPTAPFQLIESNTEKLHIAIPFVQKYRKGGYDGKGVKLINAINELENIPSVIEAKADIEKELAVIVVKQEQSIVAYPVVEMVFDSALNLVSDLFAPAEITEETKQNAIELAEKIAQAFQGDGIFAVEMFLLQNGEIWVNEVAPRVHNSGHHTIEANYHSQFDNMLRVLANIPIGEASPRQEASMYNLIGPDSLVGKAKLEGIQKLASLDKVYLHWYGKKITKPGRKMGHITILGERKKVIETIESIKNEIKITTQ